MSTQEENDVKARIALLEHILVYLLYRLDSPDSSRTRARIGDWLTAYEQQPEFKPEAASQGRLNDWIKSRAETEKLAQIVDQLADQLNHSASVFKTVDQSLSSLEARADALSRRQTEVEHDVWPWLGMMSLGIDLSQVPLIRHFPVRLYVDGGRLQDLKEAKNRLQEFLSSAGFDVTADISIEYGSIFRKFWAKSKDALTQPEVLDRLEKLERAVVVSTLEKPQAEVDALYLSAASEFLKANEGVPKVAAQVGPILILKLPGPDGSEVQVMKLSTDQLIALEKNQSWLTSPSDILAKLEDACTSAPYGSTTDAILRQTSKGKFKHSRLPGPEGRSEEPPPALPPP